MKRLLFSLFLLILVVPIVAKPVASFAASDPIQLTPETPFPGYTGTQKIDDNGIATYIRAIFIYFIWIVGILATVMIIYGGIRWVAAAGNAARINDARATINNALIGLVIALTSYALLYVINPELLNLRLPDIGNINKQNLTLVNGCIQNLSCPSGYTQTEGGRCSGGAFGVVSGSFSYVNPGDNYCGSSTSAQHGICCFDTATKTRCIGISSSDGQQVAGQCNTNFTQATTYTWCTDQTACGVLKTMSPTEKCIGHQTTNPDNICYPQFSTVDGKDVPTGSGIALPGGSVGGSFIFSGIKRCQDAGKPTFKIYFDATIDCGASRVGTTPDGEVPIYGTKATCGNGQFCGLMPFGNQCELVGPRTGCMLPSTPPLP